MAPNRKQAKSGIVDQDQYDPEFNAVIRKANNAQLELDIEKNRHTREMKELEIGKMGMLIGDGKNAASSIASVCAIFGLTGFAICLIAAAMAETETNFWSQNAERSLNVAMTALAFMYGKSAGSGK